MLRYVLGPSGWDHGFIVVLVLLTVDRYRRFLPGEQRSRTSAGSNLVFGRSHLWSGGDRWNRWTDELRLCFYFALASEKYLKCCCSRFYWTSNMCWKMLKMQVNRQRRQKLNLYIHLQSSDFCFPCFARLNLNFHEFSKYIDVNLIWLFTKIFSLCKSLTWISINMSNPSLNMDLLVYSPPSWKKKQIPLPFKLQGKTRCFSQ